MALTQIERLLGGFLKSSRASKGDQILAMLIAKTEDQKLDLCRYLRDNPEATADEIIAQAKRIAGAKQ